MLTIIDYGSGNLNSIKNILKRLNINSVISDNCEGVMNADKLILPGVGSFDAGMMQLHKSGLVNAMTEKVINQHIPILGICLGAQLLTKYSEEGKEAGLGWINGRTVSFDKTKLTDKHKMPHMAWSSVTDYKSSKLFENMWVDPRFYFVHSYHLEIDNKDEILVNANYNGYEFIAGVEKNNILGVQFHPEKSHKYGMKIFENFVNNY